MRHIPIIETMKCRDEIDMGEEVSDGSDREEWHVNCEIRDSGEIQDIWDIELREDIGGEIKERGETQYREEIRRSEIPPSEGARRHEDIEMGEGDPPGSDREEMHIEDEIGDIGEIEDGEEKNPR